MSIDFPRAIRHAAVGIHGFGYGDPRISRVFLFGFIGKHDPTSPNVRGVDGRRGKYSLSEGAPTQETKFHVQSPPRSSDKISPVSLYDVGTDVSSQAVSLKRNFAHTSRLSRPSSPILGTIFSPKWCFHWEFRVG